MRHRTISRNNRNDSLASACRKAARRSSLFGGTFPAGRHRPSQSTVRNTHHLRKGNGMLGIRTSLTRSALIVSLGAAVGTAALAGPAHAATIVDDDPVAVSGGYSDFGTEPHWFGSPSPGLVRYTLENGVVRAAVSGVTFQDNLPGHCVRTMVEFRTSGGSLLSRQYGPKLCSPSAGLQKTSPWEKSHQSTAVARVTISTQMQSSDGSYSTTASKTSVKDNV